jgi:hypothetical protein
MAAIRIFNDNNSVYIAGRAYQPGSLQASYSGDNVNVVQLHNSKAVIREVRYSYILDKDGNTWGSTAADTVTALNNYIGATNPDGIIKSTDKITDLTGITASDFASKTGYTVFVGSTDGSLQTSNAVLLDGNNLRVNGELTSSTNANLKLKPGGTGNVEIGNFEFDADQTGANDGDVLTFDSTSGTIALSTPTGGGGSSPWTTSGSDIYYTTGNVGVGTATPSEPLDVVGDVEITGDLKLTSGTSSIVIGPDAGSGANVTYGVIIGQNAVSNVGVNGGSSSVTIGWRAGQFAGATAVSNVFVGPQAGQRNTGSHSTVVGRSAGQNTTGSGNVTIGRSAGFGVNGTSTYENTVAVGYQALTALTTGAQNTAVGYQAGAALTTNNRITLLGNQAAYQLTTGSNVVAVGDRALENLTSVGGDYGALAIGMWANSSKTSLTNSTVVGNRASAGSEAAAFGGASNANGSQSTAVGQWARGGAFSTVIGYGAGDHFSTVQRAVLIGRNAGGTNVNNDSVMIGHQAGSQETGTNKLYIENSNSTTPLIYGEFDNDLVRINGDLEVTGDIDLSGGVKNRNLLVGTEIQNTANGFNSVFEFGDGSHSSYHSHLILRPTGNAANYNQAYWGSIGWDPSGTLQGLQINTGNYKKNIWFTQGVPGTSNPRAYARFDANGNLKLHNTFLSSHTAPTEKLDVVGNIKASGVIKVSGVEVGDTSTTGYSFPTATGTLGQVLEVDASGDLVFATPSGGGGGGLGSADQTLTADRTIITTGYDLDIEMTSGDLFTIHDGTHDLFQVDTGTTGTIFSVNDVSGLPKLTVDDSDGVTIDKFKEVKYEKPSNTDFSYQGDVVYFGATTGMTQGDLYYYNSSGNWAQADADAVSSSGGVLLAIALGTTSDTNGMLLKGTFTMAAGTIDGTEATGDELYVGTTAGHVTSDVSAYTTGDVVRVIGYCLDGTNGQIWFNPSNDFITLA